MNLNNESVKWIGIWAMIAVIILGITTTVSSCITQDTQLRAEALKAAVEKGVDPMVAKCAMTSVANSEREAIVCGILAGRNKPQ